MKIQLGDGKHFIATSFNTLKFGTLKSKKTPGETVKEEDFEDTLIEVYLTLPEHLKTLKEAVERIEKSMLPAMYC